MPIGRNTVFAHVAEVYFPTSMDGRGPGADNAVAVALSCRCAVTLKFLERRKRGRYTP